MTTFCSVPPPCVILQDQFRDISWRKNWIFFLIGSWVLVLFSCSRIVSNWHCQEFGREFCQQVIGRVYPLEFDTASKSMPFYCAELFISVISVLFLTGPRVDCNLGHWVMQRLPQSLFPAWLKDENGKIKLSGVGEFWLWKAALSSVVTSNHILATVRAQFYVEDGGMTTIL